MAGFSLRQDNQGPIIEEWTVSSVDAAVGDLLYVDTGTTVGIVGSASAESFERKGICMNALVSGTDTLARVQVVHGGQLWEADAANNSASTDNGDNMILTDQNTVNNTHTNDTSSEAVVTQVGICGAAADKRILVRFENVGGGLSNM